MLVATCLLALSGLVGAGPALATSSGTGTRPVQQTTVGGVPTTQWVTYSKPGGQPLAMDVYHPPSGKGPFPAIVYVHGGGFTKGGKQRLTTLAPYFAQHGYVGFAINYRLAPEYSFPDAVHDIWAAVRFIRAHAAEYQVNPRLIAIFGSSAGGTIALQAALMPTGPLTSGDRVAVAISWSGATGLAHAGEVSASHPGILEYMGCNVQTAVCPDNVETKYAPVNLVDPGDPATFLANGLHERVTPVVQATQMGAALKAQGVPYEVKIIPTNRHALGYTPLAEGPTLQFLNRYLLHYKPRHVTPTQAPPTPGGTHQGDASASGKIGSGSSTQPIVLILIVVIVALLIILLVVAVRRFRESRIYRN